MKLVTLPTFALKIGAKYATIATWCNYKQGQFNDRRKDQEFTYKMIQFVIIDGKRFVDLSRTTLTKEIYTDLFSRG